MIDELTVPLLGTLETDPDAIPRGFIHRDPDILNIHQQNTLSEMKVKMMDFNDEYLAKHPQVEALVRLLIKEIIIHKPYYVREFIKEILSRDDLESKVAKIVAAKRLNTNRRHTRHYFSHTKTWQDKAAGVEEPEAETEEPYWPEPRPFRVETRRDKREYCHPHYFKVPYVFFPAEFLKPKQPVFKTRKYPQFRSRSYARLLLQNYKDVWGDPVTNIPPPLNDEELYTASSLLKSKPQEEMTNEELIKCCIRCRRTRMRNYLYALNKKQFNDPLKRYPSYTIFEKSRKLRVANKFLERTLDAIKRKDVKTINCAWVPRDGPINQVDRELMKFETRFVPHRQMAEMDKFKSPIPGLRFKEEGAFRLLLPLADLKRNIDGKNELNPRVTILESGGRETTRSSKITVPTTDLQGRLIENSEISITLRSMELSQLKRSEDSYIRLGEHKIGNVPAFDEKHLLLEQTRMQSSRVSQKAVSRITMVLQEDLPTTPKKPDRVAEKPETSQVSFKPSQVSLNASQLCMMDSFTALVNSRERIENFYSIQKKEPKDHIPPLPSYMVDPYMQLLVDPKRLNNYFKKKNGKMDCNVKRKLSMSNLKQYL